MDDWQLAEWAELAEERLKWDRAHGGCPLLGTGK